MKRNSEKLPVEATDEGARSRVVQTPHNSNGASLSLPANRATTARPEIAVLGWDVRSYRLSLRSSKF